MRGTTAQVSDAGRMAVTGSAVMAAATLTNGLAYLVPMLGARHLTAADLGALATVQALVAIAGVAGAGLQTAVAVHRARHPQAPTARVTLTAAAVTGGTLVAAIPLIVTTLHLPVEVVTLLVGMTLPVVLAARWLGELQGDQRFLRLALGMGVLAIGRYAGVIAGLVLGAGLVGSLLAGLVCSYVALPILRLTAGSGATAAQAAAGAHPASGPALGLRQVMTASSATLAMLVASYADLILARQLLSPAESGAYSVGTVLTKGALWAPQVVTVLALPRMARQDGRTRRAAWAVVGACGAALVIASALAGGLAFRLAGGQDYAVLGRYAPFFAATGAFYALAFVLINAQIASGARWPSVPLWVAAAGLVLVAVFVAPHTFAGIMWTATAAAASAALALAVVVRASAGRRGPPAGPSPEPVGPQDLADRVS
ncbi:polysaccharide biosynthesis protein [Micromonospora cremea]|uniref:Membrane protein involved in the export of O-antigen and teichoic acid n=1 Tax=Micromonospora cremea TaxID=709881 RepID=A0A1N5ZVT0_9ACTN|nr:polysaccharide biosynthesis protein [Micromonospora cremea]SIN25835.1 Membrane protein involved in the export of O-antigen and teichoic acid [Micromonospora cremea]